LVKGADSVWTAACRIVSPGGRRRPLDGRHFKVFSAWRAEYVELFNKLVIKIPGQKQSNNATSSISDKRIAYLSGCMGGEEVENELRACKLRYSVIDNPANVTGELLRSDSILGNFQNPSSWKPFPTASQPVLEGCSGHASRTAGCELSGSLPVLLNKKRMSETADYQMGSALACLSVLVSAQIVDANRESPQDGAAGQENHL
jgi:hypothetical protein